MSDKLPKRDKILRKALVLASKQGYQSLSRSEVARATGCSDGLISMHFVDMVGLRNAVLSLAVDAECLPVIAQGIATGHHVTDVLPEKLRKRVCEWVMDGHRPEYKRSAASCALGASGLADLRKTLEK